MAQASEYSPLSPMQPGQPAAEQWPSERILDFLAALGSNSPEFVRSLGYVRDQLAQNRERELGSAASLGAAFGTYNPQTRQVEGIPSQVTEERGNVGGFLQGLGILGPPSPRPTTAAEQQMAVWGALQKEQLASKQRNAENMNLYRMLGLGLQAQGQRQAQERADRSYGLQEKRLGLAEQELDWTKSRYFSDKEWAVAVHNDEVRHQKVQEGQGERRTQALETGVGIRQQQQDFTEKKFGEEMQFKRDVQDLKSAHQKVQDTIREQDANLRQFQADGKPYYDFIKNYEARNKPLLPGGKVKTNPEQEKMYRFAIETLRSLRRSYGLSENVPYDVIFAPSTPMPGATPTPAPGTSGGGLMESLFGKPSLGGDLPVMPER